MNANGSAGDKTITVDIAPGADYRRIQDAIDNATAGDTILVYSGTYSGIVVNKPLILKGIDKGPRTWSDMPGIYYSHEGGKPIVFSGMESGTAAVTLTAGNSTLDGFEAKYSNDGIRVESDNNIIINNNASDNSRNFGSGIILNGSNNILRNNTAMHNNHGFMLYLSSNNNTLSGNTALYNRESSITFSWQYLENPRNNTIYNNSIYNNFFSYNKDNFIVIHDNDANPWNTSKTPGMNIIGGSYLGGNVWIRSKGSGFSQTCEDNDGDGICDSPYVLGNNNIDMLPLAYTPFILANKLVNIIFIISLLSTFVMAYRKRDKIKDEIAGTAPSAFTGAYRGAFYGLIVGGVVLDLTAPLFLEDLNDPGWLIMGLILGGIYGVSVGITAGIIGGVSKNPFIGAISGFIGGMVEILAFGAIRAIEGNNLPLGAIVGGIFGGAFFAIVGSVIGRAFYGANNDAIVGAIVGGIIGGFGGVVFSEVMVGGLAGAVFFGAICGSFIGGFFSKLISANKYTSIIGIIVIGVGAIVIFIKMIRGDVISENVMVVDGIIGAIVSEATTLAPADSGLVVEGIAGAIVGAIAGWIIGSKEESINGNRSLKKYGS